ncbi:hypothetical protein D3C86_1662600 [compost metagenome]
MITARLIPPVGQRTSPRMYVSSGRNLTLPSSFEQLDGLTNVQAAKALIGRAFGIGEITDSPADGAFQRGRATVRHAIGWRLLSTHGS